jgi:YHS domain-containing protein
MKNIGVILLALAAATVFASPTKVKATKVKPMHCAVQTEDVVDVTKATANHMYADYKGRRYFFCCAGCPDAFKKNPAKYAKHADSIAIPKVVKKKK